MRLVHLSVLSAWSSFQRILQCLPQILCTEPPQCWLGLSSAWPPETPPLNPLGHFTIPGCFLGEEPLKKPSLADFHRVHMQPLDTTAIALLSACTSLPLCHLSLLCTKQGQPHESLLPPDSQVRVKHWPSIPLGNRCSSLCIAPLEPLSHGLE